MEKEDSTAKLGAKLLRKLDPVDLTDLEDRLRQCLPESIKLLATVLLCKAIGKPDTLTVYEAKERQKYERKKLLVFVQAKDPGFNHLTITVLAGKSKAEIDFVSIEHAYYQ